MKKQADLTSRAALNLTYLVETLDMEKWQSFEREIKKCETEADAILTEIYTELFAAHYTSSERTQMQTIASYCDDFLDTINGCAKSFILYSPDKIGAQLCDICSYIYAEAQALETLISLFAHIREDIRKIFVQCDKISELEHEADAAYEEFIGIIFTHEKDAVKIMKYKNIAEQLEGTSDNCKRISDEIRNVLMMYI